MSKPAERLPTDSLSDKSAKMVDDKKNNDYSIEMDKLDQGNKAFEAAPPPLNRATSSPPSSISNNPALPVLAYCGSSILMTVMNKYVLSGLDFNLNFLLLMVQVCGGSIFLWQTVIPLRLFIDKRNF